MINTFHSTIMIGLVNLTYNKLLNNMIDGATTLGIMTFSIMTFSIMTFSILTFSVMTFSIMTFSIKIN